MLRFYLRLHKHGWLRINMTEIYGTNTDSPICVWKKCYIRNTTLDICMLDLLVNELTALRRHHKKTIALCLT